jgi:hypothetical protein
LKDEWESVKGTNRVLSMNSLLHKYDRLGLPKDGRLDNPAPYISGLKIKLEMFFRKIRRFNYE